MKFKNFKITLTDKKCLMFHFNTEEVTEATIKRLCRVLNSKASREEEVAVINGVAGLQKDYISEAEATLLFKHGDSAITVMECIHREEDGTYVRGKIIDEIIL